ncbi:hypothetical protein [Streptomyces sp. SBT349]|uniref:hypothetical protein n=1 Tax=Streptomyces sp. SBT349 TaxID=1580539 RepID=UPI00066EC854|nr:hypothetical protein [Streptomyces sp. SBT349]
MNADAWNAAHPVGTQVVAYPATRADEPLYTWTRSMAWALGHGEPVVLVEGRSGGIALSHVDPVDGWVLTPKSYAGIDAATDRDGAFAKAYTRYVDGKLATVGLRIGEKPGHVVAMFGDTIHHTADGTYTVTPAESGGAS